MCQVDQQTMDHLIKTVEQFISDKRAFTGYDITIETRQRENIKLRHKDCRGAVHEIQPLIDEVEFAEIPEPATIALLSMGCIAALRRRRSK